MGNLRTSPDLVTVTILLALLLAWAGGAVAREVRDLDADRDAFTPTTRTVEPGRGLIETAYTVIDNREGVETHSFPELIVRHGLTERFELRFGSNQEIGSGGSVVTAVETGEGLGEGLDTRVASETTLFYGFKAVVSEQNGWIPRTATIVEAFTPVAGDVWGTEPTATGIFGWDLPEMWRFDAAVRYVYADSEEGRFDKWLPSVVLRVPVTERFETHVEWFGNWTDGLEDDAVRHFVGPGFHYVIGNGFELGVRMGWGLNEDAANYFVDSGFALRY
jgi:hypothetical protein